MNGGSLIARSNLLPVINSCSCVCFQHKTGEQILACLIQQHVPGRDGAQLLPGSAPLARRETQRIPCGGQSSRSPANPPLEASGHAPVVDKMQYHGEYQQLVFTTLEGIMHFLIDHLNCTFFFP